MSRLPTADDLVEATATVVDDSWRELKRLRRQLILTQRHIASSQNQIRTSSELLRQAPLSLRDALISTTNYAARVRHELTLEVRVARRLVRESQLILEQSQSWGSQPAPLSPSHRLPRTARPERRTAPQEATPPQQPSDHIAGI